MSGQKAIGSVGIPEHNYFFFFGGGGGGAGFNKYGDMRQGTFFNSCDVRMNKRQRNATLAFLKIDRRHGDPPSRAPV